MTSASDTASFSSPSSADSTLRAARTFWFVVTALGQWTFVYFIVGFYFGPVFGGRFAAWNKKPLIDGYIAGDTSGNLMFAAHVLLAAVMTAGGVLQLVPSLRQRWPALHRWNGRMFLATGVMLAVGGLYLVWGRGTYFNLVAAAGITLNAALILWFSALTIDRARRGNFDSHRRWALRTFMVVNGVWMLRVGYMFWGLATRGAGIGSRMDGPFDFFWIFACYLLPLAGLEIYLAAGDRGTRRLKVAVAVGLTVLTLAEAVGVVGAYAFMWRPYL